MKHKYSNLAKSGIIALSSCLFCLPSLADEIRICGYLQTIDPSQVTVNNISYPITGETEFKDENDVVITVSDFIAGELIKVEIEEGVVDEVEKEDGTSCSSDENSGLDDNSEDDNSEDDNNLSGPKTRICGAVDAITSQEITVKGVTYPFTSSTEFESLSGAAISPEAFTVGDYVKLKLISGILDEVEQENDVSCKAYKQSKKAKKRGDENSSKVRQTKNRATTTSALSSVTGKARYRSKARSKEGRDPKVDSRFVINIGVLVGQEQPILQTEEQAAQLSLQAFITRNGSHIAVCTLAFDEVNDLGKAEYKVKLREKRGTLREKKGICSIDPSSPDGVSGLPTVQDGDIVTVYNTDGLVEFIKMSF